MIWRLDQIRRRILPYSFRGSYRLCTKSRSTVRVANQLNSRWQRHRIRTNDQPDPVRVEDPEIRPFQGRRVGGAYRGRCPRLFNLTASRYESLSTDTLN